MKSINIKKLFKYDILSKIIIAIGSLILIYLLISLYFTKHFSFNTVINEVNVSLKAHHDVELIMSNYTKNYELELIERNSETEIISGQRIGMQFNEKNSVPRIYHLQNSFRWINSLLKNQKYYVNDLYLYDNNKLRNEVDKLNCINMDVIEPRNVSFQYSNYAYLPIEEVYGNKIIRDKLDKAIETYLFMGKTKLDLNEMHCYENPKYTLGSNKAMETKNLLDKYVSTKIKYIFGNKIELLDGNIINQWLHVDENLEIVINKEAVWKYVKELSKQYDTIGVTRSIKTSTGKIVEVKGGLYGWKIKQADEANALFEMIQNGEVTEKEPIYAQKALSREKNDIGDTYVEINISRQHLWFYKEGKLIAQGPVVTGNPNKGNSTVLGTFMLNYKRKGETLSGVGYEVKVSYWMPFYGNIGLHDASWRSAFGGEIYKSKGTHGCVNAPFYLAKTIYENIEDGIPIICYEEQ